jgi:hypothetical protein
VHEQNVALGYSKGTKLIGDFGGAELAAVLTHDQIGIEVAS